MSLLEASHLKFQPLSLILATILGKEKPLNETRTLVAFFCCSLALDFSFAALWKKMKNIVILKKFVQQYKLKWNYVYLSRTLFSGFWRMLNQRFSVRISNNVGILNHHGIVSGQQGCTSVYFFLKQQCYSEPNFIEINEKPEFTCSEITISSMPTKTHHLDFH